MRTTQDVHASIEQFNILSLVTYGMPAEVRMQRCGKIQAALEELCGGGEQADGQLAAALLALAIQLQVLLPAPARDSLHLQASSQAPLALCISSAERWRAQSGCQSHLNWLLSLSSALPFNLQVLPTPLGGHPWAHLPQSSQRGCHPFPAGLPCDVLARVGRHGWTQAWRCMCASHMIARECVGRSTDLEAVRRQGALPDAIGEAGLVPGVLPIQRIGLGDLQQDPRRAAAVHSCQTLHYPGDSLAVCLPAVARAGCFPLLLTMHQHAHQCQTLSCGNAARMGSYVV